MKAPASDLSLATPQELQESPAEKGCCWLGGFLKILWIKQGLSLSLSLSYFFILFFFLFLLTPGGESPSFPDFGRGICTSLLPALMHEPCWAETHPRAIHLSPAGMGQDLTNTLSWLGLAEGTRAQPWAGTLLRVCSWSKGKGQSTQECKHINVSPWGERLRIPLCLLICKPCQRLSILSEQTKKETDAEIITTLAENLFLYPEGELQPHSCLQDRVKAFSPWYIAMAINFLDKLKLTFILKRKITCCVKHLLIWHLPRALG